MHNVYFKDKSTHDFKLVTKEIGRRKKAKEQVERFPVPYRNGDLIIHSNRYESYNRQMEFTSLEPLEIASILEWLDGYGKLKTDMDEGGFFLASVIDEVEQFSNGPMLNDLKVDFSVDPFFYLDSGDYMIPITAPTTLLNLGTIESEPLITIYGSGDVRLNVNSQFVSLQGIEQSLTMDTRNKVCYRDTLNMGKKMTGEYIRMDKGKNSISWTGNVTKIEILPRWCER